jgi:phage baseplate assembly protein W
MSSSSHHALRFEHPDLEASGRYSGLRFSADGRIDTVEGADSVRQSIMLLLSTKPGERVMRPEYGCPLHRLMFAGNNTTTAGLAIHYVRSAIERWEPRVEIVHLDAGQNEHRPEMLDIFLEYRIGATQQRDRLTFSLNLTAE